METLTLELAKKVAEAAQEKAKQLNISLSVSIVDASGRLVLAHRGDGTGFLTTDTSRAKAVAAAAFKTETRKLTALAKDSPQFWQALPAVLQEQVLPTTGAVPFILNGEVIGAIGCGGGTPEQDHECALEGAKTIDCGSVP